MKYRAMCPICGWTLMQASPNSQIKVNCPKCKSNLYVEVEENGVRVYTCKDEHFQKTQPS
ncbi:MAG TPA: hypothetical protein IAD50_07130 [Candidatus Egerieisoma faecipullorum]|uniref:Uncharacterized protein n=1 Tax=Candidatus Egerieisoma faecipullorum TaxID=2840963 RepID=A0A9D1I895_9CLOT|nr:hypothetical protein [Candidatus Egerieisoma faecipullorum]